MTPDVTRTRNNRDLPHVSYSESASFKRCRWQWERTYVDKLKPRVAAPALRFGSLVHKSLEAYYLPGLKRGPHPAATFRETYTRELIEAEEYGFRDDEGKWNEAGTLGEAMLNGYVDLYGKDTRYKVVATERRFSLPVSSEGIGRFYIVGVIDGVWLDRETDRLLMVDHKTTGDSKIDVSFLSKDEQVSMYWTFGLEELYERKILKRDQQLGGIIFNFLRKKMSDERPRNEQGQYLNKDGSVSKVQPAPLFERAPVYRTPGDRERYAEQLAAQIAEMELFRRGHLAPLKNVRKENCRGCPVRDLCDLDDMGHDWTEMAKGTMTKRGGWKEEDLPREQG